MPRARILLASAAVAVSVGWLASPAHAQEVTAEESLEEVVAQAEAQGADHAAIECIEKLYDGSQTSIEGCKQNPNPLIPETNEIIWGGLGFIVVFAFIAFFGFPAIKKTMEARTQRIRDDLDAAERQKAEAQSILEQYQRQLADAKSEAGRIIEEARQAADQMRHELQARAETDATGIRQKAQADIDSMVAQARADLQVRVAELSIQLAEKVVERNLDRDTNLSLIEGYIRELESQGA